MSSFVRQLVVFKQTGCFLTLWILISQTDGGIYPKYPSDSEDVKPTEVLPPCTLGTADAHVAWWLDEDGSLVKSEDMINNGMAYLDLSRQMQSDVWIFNQVKKQFPLPHNDTNSSLKVFSVANNGLWRIPTSALEHVGGSLQLLSLKGNYFYWLSWEEFPHLGQLLELDMRSSSITNITSGLFANTPKLLKLYLSHNFIIEIASNTFDTAPFLRHIDLSYNHVGRVTELFLNQYSFSGLPNLLFLDLSYTRLHSESFRALSPLPDSIMFLSLCYTTISNIPIDMFQVSNQLKVFDLSGNPMLPSKLNWDHLKNLSKSLQVLAFKNSTITSVNDFCELYELRALLLSDNRISALSADSFEKGHKLELIDLSFNQLTNWYTPVFANISTLKALKLNHNNINVLSSAMFRDFENLDYLSIGNNRFVCSCNMVDFIDVAAKNNRLTNSTLQRFTTKSNVPLPYLSLLDDTVGLNNQIMIDKADGINQNLTQTCEIIIKRHLSDMRAVTDSFTNMTDMKSKITKYKMLMVPIGHDSNDPEWHLDFVQHKLISGDMMSFRLRLIDFHQSSYTCINSTSGQTSQLEDLSCPPVYGSKTIDTDLNRKTIILVVSLLSTVFGVLIVYILIYYYGWYIRFFWMSLRNAVVLGLVNREHKLELIKHKLKHKTSGDGDGVSLDVDDDAFTYDVFVSYSELNRDWILNEFLVNMDQCPDIKVCLHERDFQIGMSILENIIQCMDQSRCLVLIVSENFVMSQWCQFEMNLAQHRLLESRRDQLILIMLEDVPKRKRPKTLHYLMLTKTYIKWPLATEFSPIDLPRERRLFWQRLKGALKEHEWEDENLVQRRSSSAA